VFKIEKENNTDNKHPLENLTVKPSICHAKSVLILTNKSTAVSRIHFIVPGNRSLYQYDELAKVCVLNISIIGTSETTQKQLVSHRK
jgi:hypothetical protein